MAFEKELAKTQLLDNISNLMTKYKGNAKILANLKKSSEILAADLEAEIEHDAGVPPSP